MLHENGIRNNLPLTEVWVQQPDRRLKPASPALTDAVLEDLATSRDRIIDAFGIKIPPIEARTEQTIASYFQDNHWSLPAYVTIDPMTDANELRYILRSSRFRSKTDEEVFTGMNGQPISPGASPHHDIVLFHNWRDQYKSKINETVRSWGYSIDKDSLAEAAEIKMAEFVSHELLHLAGGLAISAVVVEDIEGTYCLADRSTAGFISIEEDVPEATLNYDSGRYDGAALDESWAALNASRIALELQGYKAEDLEIADRYDIDANVITDTGEPDFCAVAGLHSEETGMIIEKLDQLYPGTIATMFDVANENLPLREALEKIRSAVPSKIMELLLRPHYSAWQALRAEIKI
jgi:hypothetical protein